MDLRNTAKLPLDLPEGYFIVCIMTTQAGFEINVRIIDEKGQDLISPMIRQSTNVFPVVTDSFTKRKGHCFAEVTIPESRNIDIRISSPIDFKEGGDELKVRSYTIIAEDSTDKDYNDLFLSVTAYQSKG